MAEVLRAMCIATCPSERKCGRGVWRMGGDRGPPNYQFRQQTGPLTKLSL